MDEECPNCLEFKENCMCFIDGMLVIDPKNIEAKDKRISELEEEVKRLKKVHWNLLDNIHGYKAEISSIESKLQKAKEVLRLYATPLEGSYYSVADPYPAQKTLKELEE